MTKKPTVTNQVNLVVDNLRPIFCDVFDDDDLVINAATRAEDVDGWDSLAQIRLIVSIEKAFGLHFSAAEISDLDNVGEMASLILRKQARV